MNLEQEIELPCRLGEYDLIRRLARGGMGEVWLAAKRGLRKPCVVKVLLKKYACNPEYRRRFLREAEILAALRHGRIVPILDFGESDGRLYLVMEFIDSVNLRTFCEAVANDGQRIPLAMVAYIMGEILEALRHAHERAPGGTPRAVIHRDVTPSNVLITSEGEVMLTDFGIARYEEEFSAELFGKAQYMAPEQAMGQVSPQSDLYSNSGILHYMLTGEPPRKARNLAELNQTLDDPPPPTGRHDVPDPMERLRVLGLEPRVALRLANAETGISLLDQCGYLKQTTQTSNFYKKHIGRRHTGGTGALPAAQEYRPTEPPPRARISTTTTVALRPPQDDESKGDDRNKGGALGARWWVDSKGDDSEDEECDLDEVTVRIIEPDAPRLFRRPRRAAQPEPKPAEEPTLQLGPPLFESSPAVSKPTSRLSPPVPSRPAATGQTERQGAPPRPPSSELRATVAEPDRLTASSDARPSVTHRVTPQPGVTEPMESRGPNKSERHSTERNSIGPAPPLILIVALVFSAAIGVALASMGNDDTDPRPPTVVAEERDQPIALASPLPRVEPEEARPEPEEARPEPEEARPEPKIPDQTPAKPMRVSVVMHVRRIDRGQIRVGHGTVISFEPSAKMKLRPGSYPLSWRKHGADSWHDVGRLKVHVDNPKTHFLLVIISQEGEIYGAPRYKPDRRSGR